MGTKEFMAFSAAQLAMKASDMEYEITTLREKLKVAEEAIAFATKPICLCFAGCPECDPTGIPTLKEALAKIREVK